MTNITAECLRELLHYNPETGSITRRVTMSNALVGTEAGFIDKSCGYRRIKIDGRRYPAHQLIWLLVTGAWPIADIDHINGDKADNRWSNLREATRSQNMTNAGIRSDNTSGFKGVYWSAQIRKWAAQICLNGRQCHLGFFPSPERAFIEYMFAAWRFFGDFARIDADYLKAIRKRKERKALERSVLWNLANPDYMKAA